MRRALAAGSGSGWRSRDGTVKSSLLAAAVDVEAHDRHGAAEAVLVVQDELLAGPVGREVEHEVDALGRMHRYTRARDRPREQAAVAGDLQHRPARCRAAACRSARWSR